MALKYDNYIFDLYGTLLDIWTDENAMTLWERMAALYSCYGADDTPEHMQQHYFDIVREEEQELAFQMCINFPEIRIEKVFARLLTEAPAHHSTQEKVAQMSTEELEGSEWVGSIANVFRVLSRKRFKLFPGTLETLHTLKENGAKLYLLSNAQYLFTSAEMEAAGLPELFDAIYISSNAHMKKPQPQFMQKLLDEQHLDPKRSVMIGNDFQSDVGVAASCGVASIFLNTDKLSNIERRARLSRVVEGHFKGYLPEIIESGDISEILDIL